MGLSYTQVSHLILHVIKDIKRRCLRIFIWIMSIRTDLYTGS